MKNILVTGDNGYIGTTLVPLLLENKYNVVGLDTDYFKKSLVKSQSKYKRIKKDIREIDDKDLQGIDCIIHLAALSNDPMGEINPQITKDINYTATIHLVDLAKKNGVKRFLFSSSCSIYGIAKSGIVDEASKTNPLTQYAKSKIEVEKYLKKIKGENFTVGILRNSTVYGFSPKQRFDLVVNELTLSALQNGVVNVLSDGTPWRPLIDVRDLSNIFMNFITINKNKINGEVINVGFNENNFQVKDLANVISKITKRPIVYTKQQVKDTRSYKVKFNKFEKIFPDRKQHWQLERSVKNLTENINKSLGEGKFKKSDYVRLLVLQELLQSGKLDSKLYWR